MSDVSMTVSDLRALLQEGYVIPAHPLALTKERKLDEARQRALTHYYLAAGAGGLAVGVHTTQFAIRSPRIGLYRPVLEIAAEAVKEVRARGGRRIVKVAGICGSTAQAVEESLVARELGYDAGLLSLAALPDASESELIDHCRAVSEVLPLFGFYLQPGVGGRVLDHGFWRRFLEIDNVVAIKVAPFNRYATLEVVRAVAESGRAGEVALYTGNDDSILIDLLAEYRIRVSAGGEVNVRFSGGLLGHWAVWTRRAVEHLEMAKRCHNASTLPAGALAGALVLANEITDANAAFFDPGRRFAGCISGLHEVLRRQGLMGGIECLDPSEGLSPGQVEEIDRVYAAYPHLNDDAFVAEHLDDWLR